MEVSSVFSGRSGWVMGEISKSTASIGALLLWMFLTLGTAQSLGKPQLPSGQRTSPLQDESASVAPQAEDELRQGTALTRKGLFNDAIPHLQAAYGQVSDEYAAGFNLAICYVGNNQFEKAIEILKTLHDKGRSSDVENLLAQAYIGGRRAQEALGSLEKAAAITPQNEKLYLLVADACAARQDFALGLKVVDIGLSHLPESPRLHYERGMLLSQLDQFDRARADFELASKLGQGSDIGYLAAAHEALFEGNVAETLQIARESIGQGFENPTLLTILGEALIRSGVAPTEPAFNEAQAALEEAVSQRPNDAAAQIALGQIYLIGGRVDDAIVHLEKAQQISSGQPSIYANLAKAYQRKGDSQRAKQALATLEGLNRAQAERIRSAPGDRKLSYGGGDIGEAEHADHP